MRFKLVLNENDKASNLLRQSMYAVESAIENADELLHPQSPLIGAVALKDDWKYGVESGVKAAFLLTHVPRPPVPVEIYYPKYKNSDQTAAWNGNRIGINGYWLMNNPGMIKLTGSVLHEWSHACGFNHQAPGPWGYIRRNYWSKDKSNYSIPYFISDNISKWISWRAPDRVQPPAASTVPTLARTFDYSTGIPLD